MHGQMEDARRRANEWEISQSLTRNCGAAAAAACASAQRIAKERAGERSSCPLCRRAVDGAVQVVGRRADGLVRPELRERERQRERERERERE